MAREVIQDFQHAVLQVSDTPYDEELVATIPQVTYEFPNGYRNEFGIDRFKIAEALFDPQKIRVPNANTMLSVAHVLTTSVGKYELKIYLRMYTQLRKFNHATFYFDSSFAIRHFFRKTDPDFLSCGSSITGSYGGSYITVTFFKNMLIVELVKIKRGTYG